MLRSTASKVVWVGRATVFLAGIAVILALLFGVASTALGANGKPFILGKAANTATRVTGLVGNITDTTKAALSISNTKGGPALALTVQPGTPPMTVNSNTEVANLRAANATNADSATQATNADQVDDTNFTFNRTGVIQPNTSVDVLNVPNIGKISATCGTGGDSFTLTYTNQFGASQQQIADQRSQNGTEATAGDVLSSGGTKNFSFTSDGTVNQGHRLLLQVAPSAQTSPNTQALTTFTVTALTQAGGSNTCRFQATATVQ